MTSLSLHLKLIELVSISNLFPLEAKQKCRRVLTSCITGKLNCWRHEDGVMVHSHLRSIMRLRLPLASKLDCEPIFAIANPMHGCT